MSNLPSVWIDSEFASAKPQLLEGIDRSTLREKRKGAPTKKRRTKPQLGGWDTRQKSGGLGVRTLGKPSLALALFFMDIGVQGVPENPF